MTEVLTYADLEDFDNNPAKAVHLALPAPLPPTFTVDLIAAVADYMRDLTLAWQEWGLTAEQLAAELQAGVARLHEIALLVPPPDAIDLRDEQRRGANIRATIARAQRSTVPRRNA